MNLRYVFLFLFPAVLFSSCHTQPIEIPYEGFTLITQQGPALGYSPTSGICILRDGHLAFKDLNRNGQLDPYEDWRLDVEIRAADLASQLSYEEIAGLMLYSDHQAILDVLSGNFEPSGLLPFQMPRDMECYRDADQHLYDFAYGMNWSGVISDQRVRKYKPAQ